jgi:hypothetical protein
MALLTARIVVAAALAVWASAGPVRPAVAQDALEYEVRAAFVYNFTKFIDWPEAALGADAFRICVVGDEPFGRALDRMIAGEAVQGRPIVRVDPPAPDAVRECQILYVGRQAAARGSRALGVAREGHTLTVGDPPTFLDQGGAVRFLLEQGRVRFDVNLAALEQAGLSMSSKLLRVARRVEGVKR